jgi:hypothetical protein
MKKSVKTLVLLTISALASCLNYAQSVLHIKGNSLDGDIQKVIEDYPNRFAGIRGDMKIQNPQSTEYECKIKPEGAIESSITLYASAKNNVCSWQALMLATENFSEAKKKYQQIFSQLNNLAIKTSGLKTYRLSGKYDPPSEEKRFAGTVCSIVPADDNIRSLKLEISLQYEMMEWKLRILIYDMEREDYEKGKTHDE